MFYEKIKHFETDWHFTREKQDEKEIKVEFIRTADQPANMFTKALGRISFKRCREKLGLKRLEEAKEYKALA